MLITIYGMWFSLSKPQLLTFVSCFILPTTDLSIGGAFRETAPGQVTLFVLQVTFRILSKLFGAVYGEHSTNTPYDLT